MKRFASAATLSLCWALLLAPILSSAQQEQGGSGRKIVNRVVPVYPRLARTMNLRGTVRLDAIVQANGTVKTVELKGGHPVLAQAAENAIRKWKWEPATHESHEPIEFHFDPQ
jgi:TonB family protein